MALRGIAGADSWVKGSVAEAVTVDVLDRDISATSGRRSSNVALFERCEIDTIEGTGPRFRLNVGNECHYHVVSRGSWRVQPSSA
jgi:hypothetical protein